MKTFLSWLSFVLIIVIICGYLLYCQHINDIASIRAYQQEIKVGIIESPNVEYMQYNKLKDK